jgi:hypothetical protein
MKSSIYNRCISFSSIAVSAENITAFVLKISQVFDTAKTMKNYFKFIAQKPRKTTAQTHKKNEVRPENLL